ncbi:hypothetical protein AOQ84DRAFT_63249 [Glonium stellatum]|uniref:Uncharacterized protein n=1 Tax=Glonium stellatum TaxID=574774 RepID=A0A8E2JRT5_9PEZI|nr:hypothetical protein AOQ84DRAFT_63249 [Glonium stellatum]
MYSEPAGFLSILVYFYSGYLFYVSVVDAVENMLKYETPCAGACNATLSKTE